MLRGKFKQGRYFDIVGKFSVTSSYSEQEVKKNIREAPRSITGTTVHWDLENLEKVEFTGPILWWRWRLFHFFQWISLGKIEVQKQGETLQVEYWLSLYRLRIFALLSVILLLSYFGILGLLPPEDFTVFSRWIVGGACVFYAITWLVVSGGFVFFIKNKKLYQ